MTTRVSSPASRAAAGPCPGASEGEVLLRFDVLRDDDDPCFDGHFPGDPIVPGAALLAEAAAALGEAGHPVRAFRRVKFSLPLRPRQRCEVVATRARRGDIALRWTIDGETLAAAVAAPRSAP